MKKNMRVVQINGIRGLFMAFFVISCLVAGFIAFPSFLTMNIWNYLAESTSSLPLINFYEGIMLWSIIAFGFYVFNKRKFIVSFNAKQELSDSELKEIVEKIKKQAIKHQILQPKEPGSQIELKEKEESKKNSFNNLK